MGAGVLLPVLGLVALVALTPIGTLSDPDYRTAVAVALIVIDVIALLVAITAMILGVTSVVGVWRHNGQPGRVRTIVLGIIGTAIGALTCIFLGSHFASLILDFDAISNW